MMKRPSISSQFLSVAGRMVACSAISWGVWPLVGFLVGKDFASSSPGSYHGYHLYDRFALHKENGMVTGWSGLA